MMFDRDDNDRVREADWQSQRVDEAVEVSSREVSADGFETVKLDTPLPERRSIFGSAPGGDTPLETEVVRVHRDDDFGDGGGFAEEEPPFDPDPAEEEAEEEESAGEEPRRERFRLIRQIFLGTILNSDYIRENYRYAVLIACMLFLSIVMLFSSLGAYIRYTTLESEVRLLRERSIRMSEMRYEQSSHSAVVRRLQERGIDLEDPMEPRSKL